MSNYISQRRTSSTEAEVCYQGIYFIFRLEVDAPITVQSLTEKKRWRMHVRSSQPIPVEPVVLETIRRKAFDLIIAHRVGMRKPQVKLRVVQGSKPFQYMLKL